MIIVGMQFGHDGSVCVCKDDGIRSFTGRESFDGIKHAIGITTQMLEKALTDAGVIPDEIGCFCYLFDPEYRIVDGLD